MVPESVKHALIVEDAPEVAALFEFILEREGYRCFKVKDGKSAFRQATTQKFDLLIVDIYLPDWNGIEVLNSLAMVQEDVPIIVCTGGDAEKIGREIQNTNVIKILQKPFEVEAFKALLPKYDS